MSRWYLDESSIWTLDYPPFFAWFERGIASLRGSDAFPLEAPKSREVDLLFMRSSVVLTEAMLVFAIFRFARAVDVDHAERNPRLSWKKDVPFVLLLTLANPGLLFVDRKIYIGDI